MTPHPPHGLAGRVEEVEHDDAKVKAYDAYFLEKFRDDVDRKRAVLASALARLEIAERQFAAGQMVTGTASGVPSLLERIVTRSAEP